MTQSTSFATFSVDGKDYDYLDLAAMIGEAPYCTLPFVKRILLENVARVAGRDKSLQMDIEELVSGKEDDAAFPLMVPRIILPDSSGIPVLMDIAALRSEVAERGVDPATVTSRVPIDMIIDHSLQVDFSGSPTAQVANLRREFERNSERYTFIKWAQNAFKNLRVFPPGYGIIHQVHLERIATVTRLDESGSRPLAYPDFTIGGDSHTPMVNALGVVAWGVGGIEAETAALGQYYMLPVPEFVGVRLTGRFRPGVTMTDVVLGITEILRGQAVVGAMLEFFGPATSTLSVPDRATLANMAPEYGATTGFWPVDTKTLDYLKLTGRHDSHVRLVEAHARAAGLFRDADTPEPTYDRVIEIDLGSFGRNVAGPGKPHFRNDLGDVAASFRARVGELKTDGDIPDGALAIAAITSCTNTANPASMIRAGLVAKMADALGLRPPSWVKTSLAPGSRAVTRYLESADLMKPLEALGYSVVGYGCTTCGGKSGPLKEEVTKAIEEKGLKVASVLSGNRNFDGRIHRLIPANYLASPAMVVAYALAGTINIDLDKDVIARTKDGKPVYLADIWPSDEDVDAIMTKVVTPQVFHDTAELAADELKEWSALKAPTGDLFQWDPKSSYIVKPPFFQSDASAPPITDRIEGARVLGMFADGLNTDFISPSSEIPPESPAGVYLQSLGITRANFNTYVGRRGNHHVMVRGTLANVRLKNLLVPDKEGWWTKLFPDDEITDIFSASNIYRERQVPILVLAGKDFGSGSSRDWAAKGLTLLGLSAVLARSFERIHRSNLVGMGILPLIFKEGESIESLGLNGTETFTFKGLEKALGDGSPIKVSALTADGKTIAFEATIDARSDAERNQLQNGGIFRASLEQAMESGVQHSKPLEPTAGR